GRQLTDAPEPGQTFVGRFGREVTDQVVLAVLKSPPQAAFEVHCHGGRQVVRAISETLASAGLQECSWQAFGSDGSIEALATGQLPFALTLRTAAILADQASGALSRELRAILDSLRLDDSENAAARLQRLCRLADLGRRLT